MKLLVGLGNPGPDYKTTRHNAGFLALDACVKQKEVEFKEEKKFLGQVARFDNVFLLKPMTFMNKSGNAVARTCKFYKIPPEDVLVVYDDKDMVFGKLRFREKGSSGGHRGMQSIIDSLGGNQKIARIKMGVDSPARMENELSTADYVLKSFSKIEMKRLSGLTEEVCAMIDTWLVSE